MSRAAVTVLRFGLGFGEGGLGSSGMQQWWQRTAFISTTCIHSGHLRVGFLGNHVSIMVMYLPNARGEERSDGRVRTVLLLVSSFLAIRVGALASLETHGGRSPT